MKRLIGLGTPATSPRAVTAAVVGAAVFLLANSAAVSLIISFASGRPVVQLFLDGINLRLLVWAGGTSLGLLVAIGGAAHPWALILGALPLAALNPVLREHVQARRRIERSQGLLAAAGRIHASVATSDVESSVVDATKGLLHCRLARMDGLPPGLAEFGVRLPEPAADRWLVVSEPIGFDGLGEPERQLLEVVAGLAAGAIRNAGLMEEIRHRAIHDPLTELPNKVLFMDSEHVRDDLEALRKLGVTVGLDDFGTGYSSLAYVKRFPVDFLKIDRCSVAGLGHDPEDEAIVDAIISLGRSLGLSTVAEGVETLDQVAELRTLGCDRMQGYLFSRPQPAHLLEATLSTPWQAPPEYALAG